MIDKLLRAFKPIPEEPYGLLPGHPQSSEEYVVEVTDYLNPKTQRFFSRRFRGAIYKVFLGLPLWGFTLKHPETPSVVAVYHDGAYAHYYLTPKSPRPGIGIGFYTPNTLRSWKNLSYMSRLYVADRLYETALHALMKGEVTEHTRERIIEAFEKFMKEYREPHYRWPDKPSDQTEWPGKYYRLVNTVANGLPVKPELPLTREPEPEDEDEMPIRRYELKLY